MNVFIYCSSSVVVVDGDKNVIPVALIAESCSIRVLINGSLG